MYYPPYREISVLTSTANLNPEKRRSLFLGVSNPGWCWKSSSLL